MAFFSEQSDALLCEWLTSPTWHSDKPSENAKFYRFAAMLMQEAGKPDIREVRYTLEEAAQGWALDYAARGGDARIAVLCERLQVLYDFFGAVQEMKAFSDDRVQQPSLPIPPDTLKPYHEIPQVTVASAPVLRNKQPEAPVPSTLQDNPLPPKPRKVRQKIEVQQDLLDDKGAAQQTRSDDDDFPSPERWLRYWTEVVRLHALLRERREEPMPPRIPSDDPKAVHAEMVRWSEEVLTATEIMGAEKRDLIGTVIDKVILQDHEIEGSTVTIKWLR